MICLFGFSPYHHHPAPFCFARFILTLWFCLGFFGGVLVVHLFNCMSEELIRTGTGAMYICSEIFQIK